MEAGLDIQQGGLRLMKKALLMTVFLGGLLLACTASVPAWADGVNTPGAASKDAQNSAPASSEDPSIIDDGIIRLTPDNTKVVRLDQDAVSVVVANPVHASVVLDSPRLLIVMPREPGTTSFTVLNEKGDTILERTVIVTSTAKKKYVRVRRSCDASDSTCVKDSYFFCPDGCYEVIPTQSPNSPAPTPEIPGNSTGAYTVSPPTEAGGGPIVNGQLPPAQPPAQGQ